MNENILLLDSVWEVTILGSNYRFQALQRARAVTLALNAFQADNPGVDLSLSVLRTKVRTRSISSEELLLEKAFND